MIKPARDATTGTIFNIQHFTVHDGPGIRTTIFMKGCPLRCGWCSNPESQLVEPEFVFWDARCIHCNTCLAVCDRRAIVVEQEERKHILVDRCDRCGRCIEECYAGALEQMGRVMTLDEVLARVDAERPFFDQSGGGVTLSGGEPTYQPEFSRSVLAGCKERGIHTAIETCGQTSRKVWESLLPYLDLILYDVKEVHPARHKLGTGMSNELILANLSWLAQAGPTVIVRRPVIPGWNDTAASTHALAQFVQPLGIREIDLLPYHRFGQGKYERLGREYAMASIPSLREEQVTGLQEILVSYGLRVKIGG